MTWQEQWRVYSEKRRHEFAEVGIVWPELPNLREIVCLAIMAHEKK